MPEINHQILADALPYLRRYSRAMIGNSKTADTLVLATIQALSQTNLMTADVFRKIDLYRVFTKILNGPAGDHVKTLSNVVDAESNVERRILGIPSQARQAFLLGAVEGFNDRQIVEILDIVPLKLPALKAEATAQIIKQVATDALIIEDEMFIAADLEDILTSLGHNVIGIERTHAAAVRAIKFARPSLILADIQLADGSCGIDAVNEILLECEVPVIFITAYPERLLTGMRPEPTFLLTKPFKVESVRAVVSQALFFETRARSARMAVEQTLSAGTPD